MGPGRRNKPDAVAARRVKVAQMYLRGAWQSDIAAEVGVSQGQVSQDLKAIRSEWRQARVATFEEKVEEELAKVDNLEREYWQAWEKSKSDYSKKSIKKKGSAEKPTSLERVDTEVITMGDPRFLAGIQWCINKRCEILGLDAPKKLEHSGHIGKTDDELAAEIEHLRKIVNGSA